MRQTHKRILIVFTFMMLFVLLFLYNKPNKKGQDLSNEGDKSTNPNQEKGSNDQKEETDRNSLLSQIEKFDKKKKKNRKTIKECGKTKAATAKGPRKFPKGKKRIRKSKTGHGFR
eukprot:Anaeramoba_flamelloidesa325216_210.p2 GENE.a325216_210~~a325216_210.p2  ORF type:complete len:115 (-),score=32.00 a325216_210:1448-1792(-)